MATVYSLICWGGRLGKSVSVNTSTDLVTLTNHGLRDGTGVAFSSGTLPTVSGTALVSGTTYYSKSISSSTFELYYDSSLTSKINFTSNGSSLILKSAYLLGLADLSRWGSSGSERIYDGLVAWNTGRAGAGAFDEEIAELGQAFDDILSGVLSLTIPASVIVITSMVNGSRSAAFHYGNVGAGYVLVRSQGSGTTTITTPYRGVLDGFTLKHTNTSYNPHGIALGLFSTARYMVAIGMTTASYGGFVVGNPGSTCEYCLAVGWQYGFYFGYVNLAQIIQNCVATKNTNGFYGSGTNQKGFIYNNISVGNVTDNYVGITGTSYVASNNVGESDGAGGYVKGAPWVSGANPSFAMLTSDFAAWGTSAISATDDFSPASASSPQVDTGMDYYGRLQYDIIGAEVPAYNNGGAEAVDIGCYEFDHGYGPHPASHTLTLQNVVVGSRILIRDQADTTTHYSADAATSTVVIPITLFGDTRDNWTIKVRKGTASPYYQPWKTQMTATAGASSIYVEQISDE